MGSAFKGGFDRFGAHILFDPVSLQPATVTVDVDINSIDTGAPDRDEMLRTKDWFDAAQFPMAHFESKSFRKTGAGTYEVTGPLTMKGKTVQIVLPFKLDTSGRDSGRRTLAIVDGTITLDRSVFSLGTGDWAKTDVIANEVPVFIHITALLN